MQFIPKTEKEIEMESMMPEGVYDYQVIESEDKVSKAGNQYTSIKLKVWDDCGREYTVFTNMALIKILKHFCDVNGMESEYQSGNVAAYSFMNKSGGKVVIGIDPEKPNPMGGVYKAKNIVKDYIQSLPCSTTMPLKTEKKAEFNDDDVPF